MSSSTKPGSPIFVGRHKRILFSFLLVFLLCLSPLFSSAQVGSGLGALDIVNAFFGDPVDECAGLTEVLEDSLVLQDKAEYDATSARIKEYIALTKVPCTFDNLLKEAIARSALWTTQVNSIVPGTVIVDPIDSIFARFDSASFPIFDPEFFDALEQEILASGEPELSLWQRFLNFFWPPDTSAPTSGEENLPKAPLVSSPIIFDAGGTPVGTSGSVASGKVTIRGVITAPLDISFSKVTSTFQYAPGGGVFVDWVSFTLPTGLEAGEKATDSYTWQAGAGSWRFRLCMDSDNGRACGEELSVLVQGSVSSAPLPSSVVGPRLVPHAPLWSGRQTGKAGELYAGPMTLRAEVQNTGDAAADAVNGRFEYSQNGTTFTPWITFSVPALSPETKTSASYSWQGGTGIFYMRSCVGVATCSSPVKAEIIPAGS